MTRLIVAVLVAAALSGLRADAQESIAPPDALIVPMPKREPAKPAPAKPATAKPAPPAMAPGPRVAAPAPPAAVPPPVPAPMPPATAPAKPSQHSTGASPPKAASASPPLAAVPPQRPDERYSFQRIRDTLVRLDSQTGQVSVCGERAGTWSCQAVPDDRTALESEIGRLIGENAVLKQQLAALQQRPSSASKPDKAPDAGPDIRVPSDAELDRAMNFLTKAWRRMVEMMADLQRDIRRRD